MVSSALLFGALLKTDGMEKACNLTYFGFRKAQNFSTLSG